MRLVTYACCTLLSTHVSRPRAYIHTDIDTRPGDGTHARVTVSRPRNRSGYKPVGYRRGGRRRNRRVTQPRHVRPVCPYSGHSAREYIARARVCIYRHVPERERERKRERERERERERRQMAGHHLVEVGSVSFCTECIIVYVCVYVYRYGRSSGTPAREFG